MRIVERICVWQQIASALAVVLILVLGCEMAAKAEVIRRFDAVVKLNPDCSLDVVESIDMDFENASRHGIFRIIPVEYSRYSGNYNLDFHLLSVCDGNNNPLNYVENRTGLDVNIRIGEPDRLLTGQHTYRLHYLVRRAVNFFNNVPEVYWNGTGNDWPFGIERADIRFYPLETVSLDNIKTACFAGPTGSTASGKISKGSDYIEFAANNLDAGSGLTMVAQLPAGSLSKPSIWYDIGWFFIDWWGLIVLPAITCVYLVSILLPRIKDPVGNQAIAVEWNAPKDLSPAEVGTLVDENCDMQDIVSTLVDLAVRGYLQIKEIKTGNFLFLSDKDYEFIKMASPKDGDFLLPHEEEFLNALFAYGSTTVKLSDLRERFYIHLPNIRRQIYQSLTDKKMFVENPETVRSRYKFWALAILGLGIVVATWISMPSHSCIGGGLIISAIIVLIASQFMPARTKNGWKKRAECLGFQRFVRLAEKDRIAVLAKGDPTIFGRLLPFAMVLGAADQWAEAFHGLIVQPPSWYVPLGYGTPNYTFSSRTFVHDLGSGMNTMGRTFASAPTSSGSSAGSGGSGFSGGFSGGGFGGGGGGSW